MTRFSSVTVCLLLASAVGAAMMTGCADESLPNRRGIERPPLITESNKAKDDAEHRELEGRQRELPASGGSKEFPGQSRLDQNDDAMRPVALLADGMCGEDGCCVKAKKKSCDKELYNEDKPVMVPGKTVLVPGTGYSIDPDWGTEQALVATEQRAWPVITTGVISPGVQHNPQYVRGGLWREEINKATFNPCAGDLLEAPIWFGQIISLPVQAIFACPWSQKTSHEPVPAGLYQGYLPTAGEIHPAPIPGKFEFVYPEYSPKQNMGANTGGIQQLESANKGLVTTIPTTQPAK